MQIIRNLRLRLTMATLLTFGLILAPVCPGMALAADSAGAGVSGLDSGSTPAGKGALAPPQESTPPTVEKPPVKNAAKEPAKTDESRKVPKGIAASAGTAGTVAASSGGGISMGWKVAGGVLGVGLLVGLAGGGGGGTTAGHQ